MRSVIGIITIIATVIHFTFGCCMHPCHAAVRCDCPPQGIEVNAGVACDDCCSGHDAEPSVWTEEPEARGCGSDGVHAASASACDTTHDCDGCRCAAAPTENRTIFSRPYLAAAASGRGDGEAIAPSADSGRRRPPDPHVHPSHGRTALHERFLV